MCISSPTPILDWSAAGGRPAAPVTPTGWERSRPVGFCRASVLHYPQHGGVQPPSFVRYARRLRRLLFVSYVVRAVLFFSRGLLHVGRVPGTRVRTGVRVGEPLLPPRDFEFQASGTGTLATWWRPRSPAQYSIDAVAFDVCMSVLATLYTGTGQPTYSQALRAGTRSRHPGTPGPSASLGGLAGSSSALASSSCTR